MEELLTNPGLSRIINHISSFLDVKSLAQCRLVSQSWRRLVERQWQLLQLEHMKTIETDKAIVRGTISNNFLEWIEIMDLYKTQNTPKLRNFVQEMWTYEYNDTFYNSKRNPLFDLSSNYNIEFLQTLICKNIDWATIKDSDGWTVLHYACEYGSIETVQLLISSNSTFDPNTLTRRGYTIFDFAVCNPNFQVPKLIMDTFTLQPSRYTMVYAVRYASKETLEWLIESRQELGLDFEVNYLGQTILHTALNYRNFEIIRIVFKALQEMRSEIDIRKIMRRNFKTFGEMNEYLSLVLEYRN